VPLEVEHMNKAEYGYRMFAHASVTKAYTPKLQKCQDVPCVLQSMIGSCILQLQANVPGVVQKLDEEYLHQVRVALRRLRVVLAIAESFCADEELSALHEQVAELCMELGRAREWDVFVTQILAPVRARLPDKAVLRASEKLRVQQHDAAAGRLQSQGYQRFLLRFGSWMHGEYWRKAAAEGLTPQNFAAQILDKRSKQLIRRGKCLAAADPGQMHRLRIACKKLRYSAELFVSLFGPVKAKRYLLALSALQDILGALNDIVVAHRLLDELDSKQLRSTLALIRDLIEHDYVDKSAELNKAWRRFFEQKAFWLDAARKSVVPV
jgi:triphosphatase